MFFVTAFILTLMIPVLYSQNKPHTDETSTNVQTECEPKQTADVATDLIHTISDTEDETNSKNNSDTEKDTSPKKDNISSKGNSSKDNNTSKNNVNSGKSNYSKTENTSSKSVSVGKESTNSKIASEKNNSQNESESSKSNTAKSGSANSKNENTTTQKEKDSDKKNTSTSKTESDTSKSNTSKKSDDGDKTESKAKKEEDVKPPKEYHIDVEHITQIGVLPTGCEIVSTKMVLDYYGMDRLSLDDVLDHLNCSELKMSKDGKLYGQSPFEAFIGDPKKYSGFGCYPPVIIDMIENFEFGAIYAEDTSSLPLDFVAQTYLTQDIPVLLWVTIGMCDSYLTDWWYLCDEKGKITKEKYTWRAEEHCMVLIGYDEKYYYFCDPLSYEDVVKYEKSLVEKRYKEIGSYSMIIRPYNQ